ncbi:MAG: hypothetical protein QNL44_08010 [Oceanospirillaceae bacterium]
MKKDIEVDKSLFKRVSSTKKANKIALPERVAEVNKHQHNADFVASQKRTSNTKGKESELAADWQRFSDADAINVAKLNSQPSGKSNAHPTATLKSKVDQLSPAQRAQIEAHKLAQKNAASPSSTSLVSESTDQHSAMAKAKLDGLRPSSSADSEPETTNFEGSKPAGAGQADLGDHVHQGAGQADLGEHMPQESGQADLGEHVPQGAGQADLGDHVPQGAGQADLGDHAPQGPGQADMGEHIDGTAGLAKLKGEQLAGVGQADMGHHVDGQAGFAALEGELPAQVTQVDMGDHLPADAMQADMGHQNARNAGTAKLTGKNAAQTHASPVSLDTVDTLETAPVADVKDSKANENNEESKISGRLTEKMSKIRSKTDDITTENENLTEHKDPH